VHILLVEDNPADARLTSEAFNETAARTRLSVVPDGVEALAFLRRQGQYADASRPDLVLLDLNMPRKDGRAVLVEIRNDPTCKRIPVLILTSSRGDSDIDLAYENGANCYLLKPSDLDAYFALIRAIAEFWGRWVSLPIT
jgi:chemotaxis family two-component system response regulator Rcp1